jgi:hypothetical protein
MNHILSLGAINKSTGEYVYPKIANKKDEYVCPECDKDLILCKGEIRVHHFRHKVDSVNPCNHYNNPGEAQIHKDAKLLMKSLLERKIPISFVRNCASCKKNEEFEIPEISETSKILLEHRFEFNGPKTADVAYTDNNELVCIFEICNMHKTSSENRPEPWFEITALTLIDSVSNNNDTTLKIPCIRCEKCDDCVEIENKKNEEKIINQQQIRNQKRLEYYRYLNYNNPNIIIIPYEYTGNIREYRVLVSKYIYQYIEKYENSDKKQLFYSNYYQHYKNTLLNIHKYTGLSGICGNHWNKNIIDIKKINELIKKDNLINPINMFRHIKDLFEKNVCKKCNNEGYCVCDLSKTELELLTNDKCLICKDSGKLNETVVCFYCKKI